MVAGSGERRCTFISDEGEWRFVFGRWLMLGARRLTPDRRIDWREAGIAFDAFAHLGYCEMGRCRERLRVDFGATGDNDRVGAAAQRLAACDRERRVEVRCDHDPGRGKATIAADHDRGAADERLADRTISLAAHDHRLAHRENAE